MLAAKSQQQIEPARLGQIDPAHDNVRRVNVAGTASGGSARGAAGIQAPLTKLRNVLAETVWLTIDDENAARHSLPSVSGRHSPRAL